MAVTAERGEGRPRWVQVTAGHRPWLLLLLLLALAAPALVGCDGSGADGDGDVGGDGDADGDIDADGDGDTDADVDGDGDGDADGDADGGPGGPLRVLTWNVQDFPMASGTVDALAATLLDLDVHVAAVQEVAEPAAFGELLDALPGYDGLLNDDPDGWSRVGIVYRRARVELVDSETLFGDDWYAFPRPPLAATLRASAGGGAHFDFVAVVLHLKARLDDESRERRRTACGRLEAWLEARLAEEGEEDYVLLGDWNDELTDWGDHNVFQVFFDRADSYSFLTLELAEAGGFTYIPFESFLDHLMVTASALDEYGPGGTTEVLELETSLPGYLTLLSDHRPVLSVFELP